MKKIFLTVFTLVGLAGTLWFALSLSMNKNGQNYPLQVEAVALPHNDELLKGDITKMIREKQFKGAALVVKNDQVIYRGSFGFANVEKLQENSVNIAYPAASLQKFITGTMIAQLVAEGKLAYDEPLADFFPQVENAETIKIRDLLNHTSGIRMAEEDPNVLLGTERSQMHYVLEGMTVTEDDSYAYTNANFTMLSGIIRKVTQKSYQENLQERVIKPLKLQHTYFWDNRPKTMVFPESYVSENGRNYQNDHYVATQSLFSSLLGAGNLFLTVDDMLQIQRGLTNGKLLTQAEYHQLAEIDQDKYGGGIWHKDGVKSIYGGLGGYSTCVYGDEDNHNLVILFANQAPKDGTGSLASEIYQIISNQ